MAFSPSKEMWDGKIHHAKFAGYGIYMNEGHAKAKQMGPQAVGCALALGGRDGTKKGRGRAEEDGCLQGHPFLQDGMENGF